MALRPARATGESIPARLAASGVLGLTGVGVAVPNIAAFAAAPVEAAATGLGILLGLALLAAAVLLYRSDVSTAHALRIAGWNTLGVVVLGLVLLLATLYPGVALPAPIAGSIMGVSAVAHVLIGVNDVRRIRARALARERERLAVLNRLARHNLRNEAQVLTTAASVLGDRADGAASEAAETVGASADRIAAISTKLKRFHEATGGTGLAEAVDAAAVAERAVAPYREQYPDAPIDVSVPDGLAVRAGPNLETALDELIENAFEHGDAATGLDVRGAADGEWVDLTVADGGDGVPDQEWELLTGDREQTQLDHGSGLGLWVVKAIAERHGGRLHRTDGAVGLRLPRA